MTADIYEQHRAAFANVSAFVIMRDGERVATLAFKFPRDGAGRLYCYLHVFGLQMVRGFANGYGYDKRSASAHSAAQRIFGLLKREDDHATEAQRLHAVAIGRAIKDQGSDWEADLRDAGFIVHQAV